MSARRAAVNVFEKRNAAGAQRPPRRERAARAPRDLRDDALIVHARGVVVAENRELARDLELVRRRAQPDERHRERAPRI